ncbi:MAG: transposase [Epulopiscium sp. Nuni2H_MBin001]|nr:MAG: transposase [Epulopiscium sp. Nuni2H_MBin001]
MVKVVNEVEKAYRFRAYPNKAQKNLMDKTFGCVRFVYNFFLGKTMQAYADYKESPSYKKCSKELTGLKQELEWLREVDKFALQNSLINLDKAYQNFFDKNAKFPKFKSKKKAKCSYRTSFTNNNIRFENTHIVLPKLGNVKVRDKHMPQGRILNATITKESDGAYYISLCYTDVEVEPLPSSDLSVGIDLGIKNFCVTSDCEVIENHRYLAKSLNKLAKLQRELSRKPIGSNNRYKAKIKVAKLHAKIRHQREDFLNKLSNYFIKRYGIICIEDLDVEEMLENSGLARDIIDVSWSGFVSRLTYKSKWHNRKLVKIDRFYPSSQLCNVCNYQNSDVQNLDVRQWKCPECSTNHDRDINAAINILKEGLRCLTYI